jgi:hypothetical protein
MFPCSQNGGPIFSKPFNNDIWVMLLEKMYAKVYGGYRNIDFGFSTDALKDLTGAPAEYIDIK